MDELEYRKRAMQESMQNSRPSLEDQQADQMDNSKREKLVSLFNSKKLSEDEFTKPGEMIPKDAGIGDFIKYNVAHFDPSAEENIIGFGGMSAGLRKGALKAATKSKISVEPHPKDIIDVEPEIINKMKDRLSGSKFKTREDFLKPLNDAEQKGAIFWSRNSDGTLSINVRDPGPVGSMWDNARALQNHYGVYAREIVPDPLSGHLVLKIKDPFK